MRSGDASDRIALRAIGQGHLAGDICGLGGLNLECFFCYFESARGEENVSFRRLVDRGEKQRGGRRKAAVKGFTSEGRPLENCRRRLFSFD